MLLDATKEIFAEYDDYVLEMRKQILKASNRLRSNKDTHEAQESY